MIKRGFITLDELKNIFHMFSNIIDCISLYKAEWDLKRVLNFNLWINDYELKTNMIWQR